MEYYVETSQYFIDKNYNLGHNILKLFDALPNFPFTTSEKNSNYY